MEWKRGKSIGRGSFSSVDLAIPVGDCGVFELPKLMAVKSAAISECCTLQKEKEILTHFRNCPQIIRCLGDDHTVEDGQQLYNVFLEYASLGTLAALVKNFGGALMESDVRRYTRSILNGLRCIHQEGFVHCDIKLQNILVCSATDGAHEVKIADFGLAKKVGEEEKLNLKGTPLYMSPESIAFNQYEKPGDVWSLGCSVVEMITGKPAWKCRAETDISALLFRIGFGEELPEIPEEISEQGKDFLQRCFVRDPSKRWTAEMLLNHPFVAETIIPSSSQTDKPSSSFSRSPRSAFDFPEWRSSIQSSFSFSSSISIQPSQESCRPDSCSSPQERIRMLATQNCPKWESSDNWIMVRTGKAATNLPSPVFS